MPQTDTPFPCTAHASTHCSDSEPNRHPQHIRAGPPYPYSDPARTRNRNRAIRARRGPRHSTAMQTKSRMNSAETTQITGWTSLALPLQVFTMQYVMKPPAIPYEIE